MENNSKSAFSLDGYLITCSEININKGVCGDDSLSVSIAPKGEKNKDKFILTLDVNIKAESGNLDIHVVIQGVFSFDNESSWDDLEHFFTLNAPALIFPYIRGYISMLTSLSGIGTVMIPTLNLSSLQEELRANITIGE